jgi:hypothetical protein
MKKKHRTSHSLTRTLSLSKYASSFSPRSAVTAVLMPNRPARRPTTPTPLEPDCGVTLPLPPPPLRRFLGVLCADAEPAGAPCLLAAESRAGAEADARRAPPLVLTARGSGADCGVEGDCGGLAPAAG